MPAIICVPGGAPSASHSVPETVSIDQSAMFMVPLRNSFPIGTTDADLSYHIDAAIDLVFKKLGKVLTSRRTVDSTCVFTSTDFALEGSFRGTTFIDVHLDGSPSASIRVDVE